jgi:hexosaminidase
MLELFDSDLFHMGGDEIYFQCWYNNPEVQQWQRNRSTFDLMDLWGHFQQTAFKKLREANGGNYVTPIVWTSDMTSRGRIHLNPTEYIIQVWTNGQSTINFNYKIRALIVKWLFLRYEH